VPVALAEADGAGRPPAEPIVAFDLLHAEPITAFPWESCRTAAERMAQTGVGRLPVVTKEEPWRVVGIITRSDLLKPRARVVEEEETRQRFIHLGSNGEPAVSS